MIEQEIVYLENRVQSLEKAVMWLGYHLANKQERKFDNFSDSDGERKAFISLLKSAMELSENEVSKLD